jgi:hypothetical protein
MKYKDRNTLRMQSKFESRIVGDSDRARKRKREKELNEFYKQANNKLSGYCKTCTKSHKKEHYQSNKSLYREAALRWRKWLIDLKNNSKCEKCVQITTYHHSSCFSQGHDPIIYII